MDSRAKKIGSLIGLVLLACSLAFASEDKVVEHDNSRLSIFLQPAISFLNFEEREYFQDAIDTIYQEFRANALTSEESLTVAKQDFQKVNFCFPVSGGLQLQMLQDHFLSAGIGFIYDNEEVVLTDRKNKSHNYSYTLQGIPLFLEYRIAIPLNFMTLSDGSLFSVALRWYWTLPGTEIYTTWGKLEAENKWYGAGFGFSVGYLIASWKNFNIFGDIGYSSIGAKSKKTFADIVPDGPNEKAKWDIGGLQLQVRVSFGVWNKPEPVENDDDDDDSIGTDGSKRTSDNKSMKKLSNPASKDSTKVPADSAKVNKDTTATVAKDSVSMVQDTTANVPDSSVATGEITEADSTASPDSSKAPVKKDSTAPQNQEDKAKQKDEKVSTAPKAKEQ